MRATDTLFSTTAQFQILRVPTSSNGTTFGPGSANNLLKSNGTSVYWTTLVASDIPTISITDKTSGTLPVTRGGTGATTAAGAITNLLGDSNSTKFYRGDKTWSDTLTGRLYLTTIAQTGNDYTGQLAITSASTLNNNEYFSTIASMAPNVGKSQQLFLLGTAKNSKNSGYVGFHYESSASNSNRLIFGLYGVDQVINLCGDGNVGIGTTSPSSKLQVNGTVTATAFSGPLTGNVTGNVTGSSGSCTGNAATATKATQDGDGNTISSTYLKLSGGTINDGGQIVASTNDVNSSATYNGGIQLREYKRQTTSCDTTLYYAPGITFHWGGRYAYKLALGSDGALYFGSTKIVQNSGTWGISISGNAATATKATQDADGNTISSTYLKLSGGILTGDLGILTGDTDKFLNFWYNTNKTAGASWRLGVLGSGSDDTNYFIIQSGTSTSTATTWNNVIRIGQNTYDAAFGGNIYPLTNNTKTLGTSSNKWSNVYSTTFTGDLIDTTRLRVVNNSSNNSDDAMVYLENKTNDEWALKINCEGYSHGIEIITADEAYDAFRTQGKISCKALMADRGTNGVRSVGVSSDTSGILYLYADPSSKGLFSNASSSASAGYRAGSVIQIQSSGTTFYGDLTGNAATATTLSANATDTTKVFFRGDRTWSNVIKQTSNATLGIDTNLKIGTAKKDLNFAIANGSGTGINDGYAGGITWGDDNSAYAGIYYQTSGDYGSRLIFGTTNSYANGVYARMIITHEGKVGIGRLIPSSLLGVDGTITLTGDLNITNYLYTLSLVNDKYSGRQGLKSSGYGQYYDGTGISAMESEAWLVYRDASGNVFLDGNAYSATRDGSGNTITSTYAKLSADNNLINHSNEFTFAASGQSGHVWFNYRTAGGTNGNITEYKFGDGKGGSLASITSGNFSGNAASASSVAWGNVTGKPNVATTDTAQTFTGTKSWGSSGAGGQLNGAATNGGINSIKIGDDVWLGDCNAGGIMGMKSTGANCGFYMYNSSGTLIGKLYFDGTNLVCDKNIKTASGCRIGESGGALYLGNSDNKSWVYVQDIASQDSSKWKLHTNGNAEFNGTVTAGTLSLSNALSVSNGGTGATGATAARNNLDIHSGTSVLTFSDGTATASFSTFGLSGRPGVFVATASNKDAFIRYDWDNSSSKIRLGCITVRNGTLVGISDSVRFSWIAIP